MQQYQFEKIYSQMEKEFGKIDKGEEEFHTMMFFTIESNLLKIHRQYPTSNSRRLKEAIALALFDIKSRCTNESFELDAFRNEENERLEQAVLMAFDPFTNEEIRTFINDETDIDLTDPDTLHGLYTEAVLCLLRIRESVETWEKRMGSNGYFEFAESYMGPQVEGDEMAYTVAMPEE
ncbi:MAG: hypothetical protein HFH34_13455 [Eubacterium sp.]|nr:hypothetical protein [Eubacterium sp.]